MPRVQKIEPVWIEAGQELSGESTNCSKLTFVPPGGTQTGIDRQSDPTTLQHPPLPLSPIPPSCLHLSISPSFPSSAFLSPLPRFPSAALPLSINVLLDEKCEGQTHIISVLMEASHSCLTLLLLRLLLDFACLKVAYGILSDCWTRWPPTQQCASISPSLTAPLWALQQLFSPVPPLP